MFQIVLCKFCGKDKDLRQMFSFQHGSKSMRKVGICKACRERLALRRF